MGRRTATSAICRRPPAPPPRGLDLTERRRTRWSYLGRLGYAEGVALQLALRERVRRGAGEEHLLLLEHPPVFTIGRNASGTDVLAPRDWLATRGIEVHETDRGGQVTYHGPGQLVGYPIVDLRPDRCDVRRYVRDLAAVLVATLGDFGIEGRVGEATGQIGVWVEQRKIASIGVHLSRWVTTHGFALNVTTDLEHFTGIVPCGMPTVELTSIERETGRATDLAEVARRLVPHFSRVFERELVETPAAEVFAACPSAS